MARNISWDESVKQNVLKLVEALLSQADDELDDLKLKAVVDVKWVTETKLRVTGKEKQTKRKREQTVDVGTKKEHLVTLIKQSGKSLNLPKQKEESGSSQQERELEAVQTILDCFKELEVREDEKSLNSARLSPVPLVYKTVHETFTSHGSSMIWRFSCVPHYPFVLNFLKSSGGFRLGTITAGFCAKAAIAGCL